MRRSRVRLPGSSAASRGAGDGSGGFRFRRAVDDRDQGVGAGGLQFVDHGDGEVLGADPGSPVGAGEQGVGAAPVAAGPFARFEEGRRAQVDPPGTGVGPVRDVAYEAGVVELITRLVARGLGVALLPSAFIRPRAADGPDLALVPVVDGPRRIECLVWSRFNPSPATRAMLDVLGARGVPGGRTGLPSVRHVSAQTHAEH